jgi:hypothetical protein
VGPQQHPTSREYEIVSFTLIQSLITCASSSGVNWFRPEQQAKKVQFIILEKSSVFTPLTLSPKKESRASNGSNRLFCSATQPIAVSFIKTTTEGMPKGTSGFQNHKYLAHIL